MLTGNAGSLPGDMIYARKLYEDSEAAHPIKETETIKVEDIHGKLLLIGAEDDVLWNTAKYIQNAKPPVWTLTGVLPVPLRSGERNVYEIHWNAHGDVGTVWKIL